MNIQDLKSNTTWQEASNTINNNNNKISLAIATLENAKLKNKGYFTTLEKLNEAIPNPTIGSKAYVGTSEPYAIYIVENGVWVDSGYTGGDEIVANITTDRIEDGAVTSEKIATSAFDSTLSVSGKIAPADVVGSKLTELESKTDQQFSQLSSQKEFSKIQENGYFLVDKNNNIGLKYDKDGFDVAKLSLHFKEMTSDTIHVLDFGFFIADKNNNIGLKYDKDGFDVAKVSNHLKSLIGGGKDWSNSYTIEIPIPKIPAIVNLTCDHLPVSPNKNDNLTGSIEFYDMNGNVFRKDISSLNKQGRSSMAFPKPNLSFDIDDGTPIKFGDWVYQDSFHLKAQYIDVFRGGRGIVSYHIQEEIQNHNPWYAARPWRKIVSDDVTINAGTGVKVEDLYCNAKGIPDGFPIKLYVNGEFYGLYTWNLKKHRNNMAMEKDNSKHIHIDGESYNTALFNGAANINWTKFEIRNPKYLVYAHSTSPAAANREYDANIRQDEIAGESPSITATAFSSTTTYAKDSLVTLDGRMYLSLIDGNIGHTPTPCTKPKNVFKNATEWIDVTFTNEVKQRIIRLSGSNSVSTKEEFLEYFDADWAIDYLLQVNAFVNCDVLTNNTQFCTWNGSIWFPMAYDQDQCYGLWWDGTYIRTGSLSPSNIILGSTYQTGTPLSKIFTLFKSEMDARYKDLFDSDILSTNHIMDSLIKWVDELGDDNIAEELSIWNETPSYRKSGTYNNEPTTGGFYDSIARVAKYMAVRETKMKQFFNY